MIKEILTNVHRWMISNEGLSVFESLEKYVNHSRTVKKHVKSVTPPTVLKTLRIPRAASQLSAV